MGLHKAELFARARASWAVAGSIALVSLGLQLAGTTARDALMYDRPRIAGGELYRLVSGHLVHLDWRHLLLNLTGLALVWALVGDRFRGREWLLIAVTSAAVINAAFWWLMPGLRWYVGLSGVLHGLLVAGGMGLFTERRIESAVVLAVVVGKLGYEGLFGPMPGSSSAVDGSVIVEAHLYGAIGGAIAAAALLVRKCKSDAADG